MATLADDGERLLFEYTGEALRRRMELSPYRLKLRTAAYGDFPDHLLRLPGLVADCLPDGWGLRLMDRAFRKLGVAQASPLDRLAFVGERAMGALAFEPANDDALPAEDVHLLQVAQSVRAVEAGKDVDVLRQLILLGGSPQGARPKALVDYDPATGAKRTRGLGPGEPWLVKFPARQEHPNACAVEHAYAACAADCQLEMPATAWFDLGRRLAAFGIRRFDRQAGMRVPMHTLAGLLHADFRVPSLDYGAFLRATRFFTRDEGRAPGKADLLKLATDAEVPKAQAGEVIDRIAAVAAGLKARLADYPIRKVRQREIVAAVESNLAWLR